MTPFQFSQSFLEGLERLEDMTESVTVLVKFMEEKNKYPYNISGKMSLIKKLKVGDSIKSTKCGSTFEIVEILETLYKYLNRSNGDLKKHADNINDVKIVNIDLKNPPEMKALYVGD